MTRYARQQILPEVGAAGQARISAAHVLVVGAGGLGVPVLQYLAGAGVGRITLVDPDRVEATNLHRQPIYGPHPGRPKAEAAAAVLRDLNPAVRVDPLVDWLTPANAPALVAAADVVLDCSDNYATRHAINRACVVARKPLVSGAAVRFDGQVSVFDLRRDDTPCYHCLFPEAEDVEEVRCAVMGVFAPITGIVGAIQAAEALKLLAGCGETLTGRLLLLDALGMDLRTVRLMRDPSCPVCASR